MLLSKKIGLIVFCFWMNFGFSQVKVYEISQVDSLMKIQPKPILILLSADWCSYCKVQKQLVQKNMNFRARSTNFYYVEFDAETDNTIIFNKKNFKSTNKKNRKQTHELALYLFGNSKPVYPTWVLLDSEYKVKFKHQGFLKPKFLDEFATEIY